MINIPYWYKGGLNILLLLLSLLGRLLLPTALCRCSFVCSALLAKHVLAILAGLSRVGAAVAAAVLTSTATATATARVVAVLANQDQGPKKGSIPRPM